jgi:hypothetical protein
MPTTTTPQQQQQQQQQIVYPAVYFVYSRVKIKLICIVSPFRMNVLSFDAGGSPVVMEVMILKHIMEMATLICHQPKLIDSLLFEEKTSQSKLANKQGRIDVMRELSDVKDPIHPTEVFDVICGTGTGALNAFGLLGGCTTNSERTPMSLANVIDMYRDNAQRIFSQKKYHDSPLRNVSVKILSFVFANNLIPYTLQGITALLTEMFQGTVLGRLNHNKCYLACVVREFNEDSNNPDSLQVFDNKTDSQIDVVSILSATLNAPIFFETPTELNGRDYIGGSVGAICPLSEVFKRLKKLKTKNISEVETVLSLAPPLKSVSTKNTSSTEFIYWIKYMLSIDNGYSTFKAEAKLEPAAIFQRIAPNSNNTLNFSFDSIDIDAMGQSVEDESTGNEAYLRNVLEAAILIVMRYKEVPTIEHVQVIDKIILNGGKVEIVKKIRSKFEKWCHKLYLLLKED